MELEVRTADADSIDSVVALLRANDLPSEDVRADPARFVLAYADDALVGVGGLEQYDDVALLRSLVVPEPHRGDGYGTSLYDALETRARSADVTTLYLLTTTAAPFFEQQGFERIDRDAAPPSIQATTEFSDLCPERATCMRRTLQPS